MSAAEGPDEARSDEGPDEQAAGANGPLTGDVGGLRSGERGWRYRWRRHAADALGITPEFLRPSNG